MKRGVVVVIALALVACGRTGLVDEPPGPNDASVAQSEVDAGSASISACMLIGGLDRVQVRGLLVEPAGCLWMTFVAPAHGGGPEHDVALPPGWGIERMGFSPGTSCPDSPWNVEWSEPTFVSGRVEFFSEVPHAYPEQLSMSLEASFPPRPGVPATLRVDVSRVPVRGECRR